MRTSWVLLGLGLAVAACGTELPPVPPGEAASLFPLAVGNRWTFLVTEANGTTNTKIQTVTGTVSTPLGPAFRLTTTRNNDIIQSIQLVDGQGRLIRTAEDGYQNGALKERLTYNPSSLRVDTQITATGATYDSSHQELSYDLITNALLTTTNKTQRFFIEASDEAVTVPAGTYRAVKVRRETVGSVQKTYWYAFGVGKVKEVGGQTEELQQVELVEATP